MPVVTINKVGQMFLINGPANITHKTERGNRVVTMVEPAAGGAGALTRLPPTFHVDDQALVETDGAIDGPRGRTVGGQPLCGPSDDGGHGRNAAADVGIGCGVQCSEAGGGASAEGAVGGSDLQQDAESGIQPSDGYATTRAKTPDRVYKMESTPRGKLLIINNERFQHPHMENRNGTQQDCEALEKLFQKLGFIVQVAKDCTAQEMRQKLNEFAQDPELSWVDGCVVAIMSHGGNGDIIYGCDGEITQSGDEQGDQSVPVQGTYIHKSELRDIFSDIRCTSMAGKPKLFIIQACRGGLEDASRGPSHYVPHDHPTVESQRQGPNFADQYFLHATVADYVAYRNKFVQILAGILENSASSMHIKDIATEVHNKMSKVHHEINKANQGQPQGQDYIFTISEESGTLRKHWFLNPPTTHSC